MTSVRARFAPIASSRQERGFGLLSLLAVLVGVPLVLAVAAALTLGLSAILASDRLPSLDVLTDYRPKVPLRIWTADGVLIGEFGEERRSVARIEDVPQLMKQAILAAEDDRFFEHSGVDLLGIVRAEGLAALIATHNHKLINYTDRTLLMHEGKLVDGGKLTV